MHRFRVPLLVATIECVLPVIETNVSFLRLSVMPFDHFIVGKCPQFSK